jgi:hypothetical protein
MEKFKTYKEAEAWMVEQVNDPCIDNLRSTFMDSKKGMETYKKARLKGCCGFFDDVVIIAGKKAMIGCNYGH